MDALAGAPATRPAPRPTTRERPPLQRLGQFCRTPKGTVLLVLVGLLLAAMVGTTRHTLPDVLAAVGGAVAVELAVGRGRGRPWAFPSGAILSGLFVALVLARATPPYVPLLTGALAVGLKHALRTRWSNVFNPAALALVVTAPVLHAGQSWWGALPYAGPVGFVAVLAAGWYVAQKIHKLPLALAFLLSALLPLTVAAFCGDAAAVAQVFRAPDINALVFCGAFMLTDPPTSPARQEDQLWFGAIAGALGAAVFLTLGAQWFILAGLPIANACESWRRVRARPRGRATASRTDGSGAGPRPASRAPTRPQAAWEPEAAQR